MRKSGIYAIYNSKSGKVYVGQTIDLERREYDHFYELKRGKHHNNYLQRAYNADGNENFHFVVLEECSVEELDKREVYWIDHLQTMDSMIGYNLEGGGNRNKTISEDTRKRMSGENHPFYGRKLPQAQVEILKVKNRGHNSSLNEEQAKEIKLALYNGANTIELAEKYGVSKDVICKIKTGKNWYWVLEELNPKLHDNYKKEQRNKKIFELDKKGCSRNEIARELGINNATVARVLNKPSNYFIKNNKDKQKLNKKIVNDYLKGIDRKVIMAKYGVDPCRYVKAISEAYNKKMEETKKKAIELRKSGMMVKDIAKQLGYARTTISKWTLPSCEHRDNHTK